MTEHFGNSRKFAEEMAQSMRSILEEGRDAIPMCFARRSDGKVLSIALSFEDDGGESKDFAAYAMRLIAQFPDTEYVVFLADAWMATLKKEEYQEFEGSVRNIPGRKEAIVVSVFGRNCLTEVGHWAYEKVNGKLVFPEAMTWMTPETCEGRFVPEEATTRVRQ